jgi:type IV pilus assembly protein PilW
MLMNLNRRSIAGRQSGLSLVELLIAITLDLVIVAAVAGVFIKNIKYRNDIERANVQLENGRYATQVISDDLELAGYLSTFDVDSALSMAPPLVTAGNHLPVAVPNPCDGSVAADGAVQLGMTYYIQPYDQGTGAPSCVTSDIKPNTDVVVIRRASACVAGSTDCDWVAGAPYLQVAHCKTQLSAASTRFQLGRVVASLNRQNQDCATLAESHQFLTRIYFIANNNNPGDGIPTLKRAELWDSDTLRIVPIAEGIEDLQLVYGLDDAGADGVPDTYVSDVLTYVSPDPLCAPNNNTPTGSLCNMTDIMAVQVGVLARGLTVRPQYKDTKTYTVANVAEGPFNDGYERHAFDAFVKVMNPAVRRDTYAPVP